MEEKSLNLVKNATSSGETKSVFSADQLIELRASVRSGTKPSMCKGCPRYENKSQLYPDNFVWGRGSPDATIEYLGRDPGVDEVRSLKCFVGGAGRVQAKLSISAGMHFSTKSNPEGVYITNVVKCNYSVRGKNNIPPSKEEIKYCSQYRDFEGTYIKPNIRIVLGNEALFSESGNTGIEKWRGSLFKSKRDGVKCLATCHPAWLMRGKQDYAWVLVEDLRKARAESYTKGFVEPTDNYNLNGDGLSLYNQMDSRTLYADLETTGLDTHGEDDIKIVGISVDRRNVVVYTWDTDIGLALKGFIEDPENTFINHNAYLFDLPMIEHHAKCVTKCTVYDTMIMSNLAHSDLSASLAFNSSIYTNRPYWKHTSRSDLRKYNAEDVANTTEVFTGLKRELVSQDMWDYYLKRTVPLTHTLMDMNRRGIRLDFDRMLLYRQALQKALDKLEDQVKDKLGDPYFMFSSPKQVADLLYNKLGLPTQFHPVTNKPTTNVEAMENLALHSDNPIFKAILTLRTLQKQKSTYMSHPGPIHYPELNCHTTGTGRLAAPIVLVCPQGMARSIFLPDNDEMELYYADWRQIEFVTYAIVAGQTDLLEALEHGFDVHSWTASEALFSVPYDQVTKIQRHTSKFVNYGLLFGRGARSLSRSHGGTEAIWKGYILDYSRRFDKIWTHRRESVNQAMRDGYLANRWGRRRFFNAGGTNVGPKIFNLPAQGNAWEVLQDTLLTLPSNLRSIHKDSRILFPLHDAVLVQGYKRDREKTIECLRAIMERPVAQLNNYTFKIDIGIGKNFDEASK